MLRYSLIHMNNLVCVLGILHWKNTTDHDGVTKGQLNINRDLHFQIYWHKLLN